MSEPIRVVIADDHPIWVSGLKADLGVDFDVVGSAEDAAGAIEQIDALQPDVCLCDLQMPEGGGLRVAQQRGEQTNVVILTVSEAERDVLDAVAAGALGYLTKSTGSDDLRDALRRAMDRPGPVIVEAILDSREYDDLVLRPNRV